MVGINSPQSLHHFIAKSPWSVTELRKTRLDKTLLALKGQKIIVIIDETGDRKKGNKTDYVARQYLGSIGKIDRGMVSVNAYGVSENITFPLMFKVFKPKGTLKENDQYKTKIELAAEIITELIEFGFKIELVLADSLYGESSFFIRTLDKYQLPWILAIRNSHGVWIPKTQTFLSLQLNDEVKKETINRQDSPSIHPQWDYKNGWKNVLNNLRLIIQPTLLFWLLSPWLDIFPNSLLCLGFHDLIRAVNQLHPFYSSA